MKVLYSFKELVLVFFEWRYCRSDSRKAKREVCIVERIFLVIKFVKFWKIIFFDYYFLKNSF